MTLSKILLLETKLKSAPPKSSNPEKKSDGEQRRHSEKQKEEYELLPAQTV